MSELDEEGREHVGLNTSVEREATVTLSPRQIALRERSGRVETKNPLVVFLYLLMRDAVSVGVVGRIVKEVADTSFTVKFCNGWLASYAIDVAEQLKAALPRRHKDGSACLDDDGPLGPCEQPHLSRLTEPERAQVLLALRHYDAVDNEGISLHSRMREHFFLEDLEAQGR